MQNNDHKKINFLSLKRRSLAGFTLIELMISIFIFALIMTSVVTIFTREIVAYRTAREVQKNLENAQFTLNFIAKTLRTSQVNDIEETKIYAYDHSQGKCFVFAFESAALTMQKEKDNSSMKAGECDTSGPPSGSMNSAVDLTIGEVTGRFDGKMTAGSRSASNCGDVNCVTVGAITTSLVITPEGGVSNGNKSEKLYIQSTVSLRDYPNAGISL